jgi:hypothetical protein
MRRTRSLGRALVGVGDDIPCTRAAAPLLRANDAFLAYRKGPLAMWVLSEYMGEERVNEAIRRLREEHGSGAPSLRTQRTASVSVPPRTGPVEYHE